MLLSVEVKTNAPQDRLQQILNPKQVDIKARYLTRGVFDLVSGG